MNTSILSALDGSRDRLFKHLHATANLKPSQEGVEEQIETPVAVLPQEPENDNLGEVVPLFIRQNEALRLSAPSRNTMNQ
jgi:hypothetical protein